MKAFKEISITVFGRLVFHFTRTAASVAEVKDCLLREKNSTFFFLNLFSAKRLEKLSAHINEPLRTLHYSNNVYITRVSSLWPPIFIN